MKYDSKTNALLERLRAYADRWNMAEGVAVEKYQWVTDFAEKQSEQSIKTIESLDSKADAMMRYIGMLITLVALALTYAISKDSPRQNILFFLPVLMALLFSIWNALLCTRPTDYPRAPFIQEAFADAQYPTGNKIYFMRAWIELEFHAWLLSIQKSNYIETALYGFLLALIWLVLGILCVIFKTPLSNFIGDSFFPIDYDVLVVGLASVVGLYLYRRWKSAEPPLADWLELFPETEGSSPGTAG